jgi:hypothetical protein
VSIAGSNMSIKCAGEAKGEGVSTLFLDDRRAQAFAARQAKQRLRHALDQAVDVVPCPSCGWIQAIMKDSARGLHLRRVRIAGVMLLSLLIVPLLMFIGAITMPPNEQATTWDFVEITIIMVLLLGGGGGMLVARAMACKQYDPNDCDVESRLRSGRERAVLLADLPNFQKDNVPSHSSEPFAPP